MKTFSPLVPVATGVEEEEEVVAEEEVGDIKFSTTVFQLSFAATIRGLFLVALSEWS